MSDWSDVYNVFCSFIVTYIYARNDIDRITLNYYRNHEKLKYSQVLFISELRNSSILPSLKFVLASLS